LSGALMVCQWQPICRQTSCVAWHCAECAPRSAGPGLTRRSSTGSATLLALLVVGFSLATCWSSTRGHRPEWSGLSHRALLAFHFRCHSCQFGLAWPDGDLPNRCSSSMVLFGRSQPLANTTASVPAPRTTEIARIKWAPELLVGPFSARGVNAPVAGRGPVPGNSTDCAERIFVRGSANWTSESHECKWRVLPISGTRIYSLAWVTFAACSE